MIITARYGRKVGQPGYCSLDCGCSIQVELHRPTPETARAEAAKMFDLAKGFVEQQLAGLEQPAGEGGGQIRSAPGAAKRPPANGKQLYAWARRREQATGRDDVVRRLTRWGEDAGCPRRMLDWDGPQTAAALLFLEAEDPRRN